MLRQSVAVAIVMVTVGLAVATGGCTSESPPDEPQPSSRGGESDDPLLRVMVAPGRDARLAAAPRIEDVEIGPFPELRVEGRDDGVLVPTFAGDVHYDAERGAFAWPARTCKNPNCPGAGDAANPVVFARPG